MYSCPESKYVFDQCKVNTCKNWSEVAASQCVAIERNKLRDGTFSVQELAFYRKRTDSGLLEKQIKADASSVHALLAFEDFYKWACEKCPNHEIPSGDRWEDWLSRYPIGRGLWPNQKALKHMLLTVSWNAWMAQTKIKVKASHPTILHCTPNEYKQIHKQAFPQLCI